MQLQFAAFISQIYVKDYTEVNDTRNNYKIVKYLLNKIV